MTGFGRFFIVGCAFAVAGALATAPFLLATDAPGDNARLLVPAAALAAFAVGIAMWGMLVSPGGRPWTAPVAGALTGLISHPVMWALMSIPIGMEMNAGALQQAGGTVLSGAFFGLFSALTYGLVTVPLAAVVGGLLGRRPALRGVARADRETTRRG